MTDLRAHLTDALALEFRDDPLSPCEITATFASHLADVLLRLPGIAIVELPEAHEDVRIYKRSIWILTNALTPGYAREIAAALLAAANAAESVTK